MFSVWLNGQSAEKGSVLFGEEDPMKYNGVLHGTPLNMLDGASVGWTVNLTSASLVSRSNEGEPIKRRLTGTSYNVDYTVDSGSLNMYVPRCLYFSIVEDLNATDIINGAPYVPCSHRTLLKAHLEFEFQTQTDRLNGQGSHKAARIQVPYNEIIYPFGYPVTVPPVRDESGMEMRYFGIVPTDGPIRLLGATFMRSAYLVFDADNLEIKVAQAEWSTCV
jgi:hypothetical protein